MNAAFSQTLRDLADSSGLVVAPEILEKMAAFYHLLVEANRSFNLTAITGPAEAAQRHFMDSLAPPALKLLSPCDHVIDVGSGAGFPGLPIAMLHSSIHMVLLDSMKKRTSFLDSIITKLELPNVTVVTARAEEYARGAGREAFEIVLSRAVAPMNALLEYTLPFSCVGGQTLAWKGPSAAMEIKAAANACRALGGGEIRAYEYTLPDSGKFFIVAAEKIRPTPLIYPRKTGKPSNDPIK